MDNALQQFEPDNRKFRDLLLGSLGVVALLYAVAIMCL